jgi:CMP-N-acetylneuraminic acid synthetase
MMEKEKRTRVLGVVHARGGSKRVPLKNLKLLAGRPLVTYIIEAALRATWIDRLIVSTDHSEIARVSKSWGAEVPFRRPENLSEDVPSEWVTQHAVRFVEEEERAEIAVAVTLQPTTPFCTAEDIDACIARLMDTGADSVVSVCEIRERPEWMVRLEGDRAVSFLGLTIKGNLGVSQKLPRLYLPNGGIYATRRDILMEQGLIMGADTRAVVMDLDRSIDIDEPIDFTVAEVLAQKMVPAGGLL